jgi:hypothetical protein
MVEANTSGPERRAWVRYGSAAAAVCRDGGALRNSGWIGKVRDISAGGVGLVLRHRFRVGTPLSLDIKNGQGDFCVTVEARVIHVNAEHTADSGWLTGCSFLKPLSDDELKKLL